MSRTLDTLSPNTVRSLPRRAAAMAAAAVAGLMLGAWLPGAQAQQVSAPRVTDLPDCRALADASERQACLRERGAARQAARNGQLTSPDQPTLLRNALARCQPLPEPDRALCERRILGEGKVEGSVAGGGVLRELRIVVPAAETSEPSRSADPAAPAPAAVTPTPRSAG